MHVTTNGLNKSQNEELVTKGGRADAKSPFGELPIFKKFSNALGISGGR